MVVPDLLRSRDGGAADVSSERRDCPVCGTWTDWSGDFVFHDREPTETVTYFQCRRCSHLWVPDPPAAPRWPDYVKEA